MQRANFFQRIALTILCVLHDMVSQVCVMNSARLCIWISLGEARIAFFPSIRFIFLLRISPQAKKLFIAFKIAAMCTTSPLTFILRCGCWYWTISTDMCFMISSIPLPMSISISLSFYLFLFLWLSLYVSIVPGLADILSFPFNSRCIL